MWMIGLSRPVKVNGALVLAESAEGRQDFFAFFKSFFVAPIVSGYFRALF
jgi:hypothetical protein